MSDISSYRRQRRKRTLVSAVDDEELKNLERVVLGSGNDIFSDDSLEDTCAPEKPADDAKSPAWIDEDDKLEDEVLTNSVGGSSVTKNWRESKFLQVTKKPKWATNLHPETEDEKILKKCSNFIKKPKALEKGLIELKKLTDLNSATYNEGPITSIKFHPKSTVALVTGLSGVVSLFQVDGRENSKLQSIKFHKFPVSCASFLNNAEEFIIGSQNKRYFHSFNLMTGQSCIVNHHKMDGLGSVTKFVVSPDDKIIAVCGKSGKIYLLSVKTKECVDSFQMNCDVNALAFNSDGSRMYSHGAEGEVYVWDIKARRCIQKFVDDGCLSGTAVDVSSNNSFIACGSSSGIVNIYDEKDIMADKFQPLKVIYNIVTPVTNVTFNPTSEILSISSVHKENAIRLVHLSSMTAFSNFPAHHINLNHVRCVDFSPNSGYFAVGDSKKTAHLFRLKYYGNY